MTAGAVIEFVKLLNASGIEVCIDGGKFSFDLPAEFSEFELQESKQVPGKTKKKTASCGTLHFLKILGPCKNLFQPYPSRKYQEILYGQ